MNNITLGLVFAAGVVSFLSPCVLPLLPTYIALLAGTGLQDAGEAGEATRSLLLVNALCFLLGFAAVFIVMGATASYVSHFLFENQDMIRKAGAIFMGFMGVHLAGVVRVGWLHREYRPLTNATLRGPMGALLLGMAFTIGWTPCIGPVLASVLVYAAAADTVGTGVWLLFVYAMGFSLPFLLMALLFHRYALRLKLLYKWLPHIQRAAGLVLAATAVVLYFDLMNFMLGWILDRL